MNQFTLKNNLKVIHKEIKTNPIVSVQVFLYSGSANEEENQAGLANFTKVIMLKGTKKRSAKQLAIDIESIGSSISSDVSHDYCSYGVSTMDSSVDKAAEILSDVIKNPSFDKDEIEKERLNVIAGIKSRQDSIFSIADDLFNSIFYGSHPYSWPDIGKIETVSSLKREDLINWHRKYYCTGNMLLVITGNVSLKEAKKISKEYFSDVPKSDAKFKLPDIPEPEPKKVKQTNKKFQQSYLMIGFPSPSVNGNDYPVLKVINATLGGRMSGRLFIELREKLSLGYEVSSFYPSRKHLSRFVIYLGLMKKNLQLAKDKVRDVINDLKEKGVTEEELNETKNYIRGIYLLRHQTVSGISWHLGWWEVMGKGYDYDEKYLKDLMNVTSQDVKRVANKYFKDDYIQVEIVSE
ncbi:MAG: insulinase family protein [Endomicrobiales bacterium]|nr:insulinase family protein [Endomicrobiales bacterium]